MDTLPSDFPYGKESSKILKRPPGPMLTPAQADLMSGLGRSPALRSSIDDLLTVFFFLKEGMCVENREYKKLAPNLWCDK